MVPFLRWARGILQRLGEKNADIETAPRLGKVYTGRVVESITDGDTLRFSPPIGSGVSVRLLNIDTPELGGDTQEPWAISGRDYLQEILPPGSEIVIQTPEEEFDTYGRILGHVFRATDMLNLNRQQVRMGQASTYFIWPNVTDFMEYRREQIWAQQVGVGIWDPEHPLSELAFEFRLRTQKRVPDKYVGDWLTKCYFEPSDYARVNVHNRLFFWSEADAEAAGYRKWKEPDRQASDIGWD